MRCDVILDNRFQAGMLDAVLSGNLCSIPNPDLKGRVQDADRLTSMTGGLHHRIADEVVMEGVLCHHLTASRLKTGQCQWCWSAGRSQSDSFRNR